MFKIFILLALVAIGSGRQIDVKSIDHRLHTPYIFETQVNRTSECVKNLLNKGNPSIGLPSFDPLYLRDKTFNIDTWEIIGLSGTITLRNFVLRNAANWILSNIKVEIHHPGFYFNVVKDWANIQMEGDYVFDITMLENKITGSGKLFQNADNLSLKVKQDVSLPIHIDQMETLITLGQFEMKVDQVLVNGNDVTDVVNDHSSKVAPWINEHSERIGAAISRFVMAVVNNVGYLDNSYGVNEILAELLKCLD